MGGGGRGAEADAAPARNVIYVATARRVGGRDAFGDGMALAYASKPRLMKLKGDFRWRQTKPRARRRKRTRPRSR